MTERTPRDESDCGGVDDAVRLSHHTGVSADVQSARHAERAENLQSARHAEMVAPAQSATPTEGTAEGRVKTRLGTGGRLAALDPAEEAEAADESGLKRAFLAHGRELFGFARRALDDSSAAEEAVQETFVRAWRARNRFDPRLGTLRTWLFAIQRNVVIDQARARSLRRSEPLVEDVVSTSDEIERAMMGWQVEEGIRRLRPEHRQVLLEIYYSDRSSREVALQLGIPEGTVRSRLFYALRSLRLALEEMGWEG